MFKIINLNFKLFFFRVLILNILSFIYLSKTYSYDFGFISIQSFFYSINIYLIYLYILFEGICSFLNEYGLDLNFYKIILNNYDNLNYNYVWYILYKNINIVYFIIFSIFIFIFLEKKKIYNQFKF